ncbi:MAG: hypothetical protein KIT09_32755 [Bryobacteraceae bacterium]|nr:hypothetical protein [Bryobacteraceae bacterium]
MSKPGISVDIPAFGRLEIWTLLSDYTGSLSCGGKLAPGVEERLLRLSELIDIHVLTSDTFNTAQRELARLPLYINVLAGENHDVQKAAYMRSHFVPNRVAALGNGANDRLLLRAVKEGAGLAIAVDNGEGCSLEAMLNAHLLISSAAAALDLLLDPNRLKATLRC